MTAWGVSIRTRATGERFTFTRPKFEEEVEARRYARWLMSREEGLILGVAVARLSEAKANAMMVKTGAKGMHGYRLVFYDDRPGDEPSLHALHALDNEVLSDEARARLVTVRGLIPFRRQAS